MTKKTYDVLYSLRGDAHVGRHLKTVDSEASAFFWVRRFLAKLPDGNTPHNMAITCDDGRTIFTTEDIGWIDQLEATR